MKFNWGTGITIFIIAFMGFILFMVNKAFNTNTDLNAENYYEQEINFQSQIDAVENGLKYKNQFRFEQGAEFIQIDFPSGFPMKISSGSIHFYRPDDASLDRIFEMKLTNNRQQLIPNDLVAKGGYLVKFQWKEGGQEFYTERNTIIN